MSKAKQTEAQKMASKLMGIRSKLASLLKKRGESIHVYGQGGVFQVKIDPSTSSILLGVTTHIYPGESRQNQKRLAAFKQESRVLGHVARELGRGKLSATKKTAFKPYGPVTSWRYSRILTIKVLK